MMDNPLHPLARRAFLADAGVGLGAIALGLLAGHPKRVSGMTPEPATSSVHGAVEPHHPPKAKAVIQLFMTGAPSQLDLFDPKPLLAKHEGQPVPEELVRDQRYAFINRDSALLGPRFPFAKHGECGMDLSDRLPHLARIVDDIAFVRSMTTDAFNHAPAQILLCTGSQILGRPSMGAWVVYGLGTETEDLPAFVVLASGGGASGGAANFGSGFLPSRYQGVPFRGVGDPIIDLASPPGFTRDLDRASLDLARQLNQQRAAQIGDPEIESRIAAYETAFRMQVAAPELVDLGREGAETLALYGAEPGKPSFANNCLMARRLVERGVRFVQVIHEGWDHHSDVAGGLRQQCALTDRASAALVTDLKRRGLLEETLVVWGGEFGRTPMVESNAALGRKLGRDHHPQAFTMWFAGGGICPGTIFGKTDDLGFHIVENPVHIHDLQATILYLLGIDHERFTFRHQGRDFRLTDVFGHVVKPLIA